MNSLGSILKASNEEIKAFCQHTDRIGSESQYLTRQQIALTDANALQAIGASAAEVIGKLSALLAQATETPRQIIELDGSCYLLDNFMRRAKMIDDCIFCAHQTRAPRCFTIQNCSTKDESPIIESTWHDMQKHDYFGRPDTMYRIDPLLLCKVLQIGKKA